MHHDNNAISDIVSFAKGSYYKSKLKLKANSSEILQVNFKFILYSIST